MHNRERRSLAETPRQRRRIQAERRQKGHEGVMLGCAHYKTDVSSPSVAPGYVVFGLRSDPRLRLVTDGSQESRSTSSTQLAVSQFRASAAIPDIPRKHSSLEYQDIQFVRSRLSDFRVGRQSVPNPYSPKPRP
jgi:hypothetical protein